MDRRFFLTTLFKGVVASTVAYSLPIIGKEFSEVYIPTYINTPRLTAIEMMILELERVKPMLQDVFDRDDTFYWALNKHVEQHRMIVSRDMRVPLKVRKWKT